MDSDRIISLWDKLSDFGAHETDCALDHCMEQICHLVGADKAFWIGGVRVVKGAHARRDPMLGWRIGAVHLYGGDNIAQQRKSEVLNGVWNGDPGEATVQLIAKAGEFRAHTLQSGTLVDLASFSQSTHYDYFYRNPKISDRMWVAMPISEDAESYFTFDRIDSDRCFTPAELDIVAKILRGIKWFHRQLLLSHGLGISREPLTAAEHRVKQLLLSGDAEKDIANKLSLTPGTVHQYAVRIYRKFGVKGRTEFMSLWLHGHL